MRLTAKDIKDKLAGMLESGVDTVLSLGSHTQDQNAPTQRVYRWHEAQQKPTFANIFQSNADRTPAMVPIPAVENKVARPQPRRKPNSGFPY